MKTLEQIKQVVLENMKAGRFTYDGLTSDEIARRNRALMFGENDEAFPDAATWSRIVD